MALIARVTLIEGCSYSKGGNHFIKNRTQILQNEEEINYQSKKKNFKVEIAKSKQVEEKKAQVKVEEDIRLDDVESKIDEKTEEKKEDKVTASKLESMKKTELVKMGAKFGLYFDGVELKKDMIADLLEAQNEQ